MSFFREIGIAVLMVIATLWLQSVGLAVLILWISSEPWILHAAYWTYGQSVDS
jgi:hypothetical protein